MRKPIYRKTYALVNLENLRHNLGILRNISKASRFFCPMVKSNAYGHGDVRVAKVLTENGVDVLGVALVEEGLRLRRGGIRAKILIFGPFHSDAGDDIVDHSLIPVVGHWEELSFLKELSGNKKTVCPVHIKFNTGMNRLGFELKEAESIRKFLETSPYLKLEGVCSHLSHGEDGGNSTGNTTHQIIAFKTLTEHFDNDVIFHLWNSSGWISQWAHNRSAGEATWGFRPGIALYGIEPKIECQSEEAREKLSALNLKPVMSLHSEVVTLHEVKEGEHVSYGGRWVANQPGHIGVVPIGYADGYSRHFSNKGIMLIRGEEVPVRGTVCMDYTMIDVTGASGESIKLGEPVVIFGTQKGATLTARRLSEMIGTIPYEIVTCIGRRVPRRYVGHNV